jgi:nucleotidyltransferase/DNA polymerase involved in DNA repair
MVKSEPQPAMMHVDLDAFFASVEQLLIPSLRGRPIIGRPLN